VAANGGHFASDNDERSISGEVQKFGCLPGFGHREVAFEQSLKKSGSLLLGGQCPGGRFFAIALG
jgi:hypothetical protein